MVNNLRARREALGVSLRDMAKVLKVAPSTLSRWEAGQAGAHQFYRASTLLDLLEGVDTHLIVRLRMALNGRNL